MSSQKPHEPADVISETNDRTSSEEEQLRDNPAALDPTLGLPPKVPVKVAAKASLQSEPTASLEDGDGEIEMEKKLRGETPVKTLDDALRRKESGKPVAATKKGNVKTGKVKAGKKVAMVAKSNRRRKRKAKTEATGISQASAEMLFRCSCQLLRTQALDYDVRARDMEERNSMQAKEIGEWKKRIRSLKRELQEYDDEQTEETAGMALIEARPSTASASANRLSEQQQSAAAATASSAVGAVATMDTSLPPAVLAAEAKLHEELHKRARAMDEFCRSVPGFVDPPYERR